MLQFEELRLRLEGLLPDIEDLAHAVGIKQMLAETEELDARAAADGFWDDMDAAQKVVQKTAILKAKIESYNRLVRSEERRVGKECRSRWSPYH